MSFYHLVKHKESGKYFRIWQEAQVPCEYEKVTEYDPQVIARRKPRGRMKPVFDKSGQMVSKLDWVQRIEIDQIKVCCDTCHYEESGWRSYEECRECEHRESLMDNWKARS